MARMTAARVRALAREALLLAGGRGFVRYYDGTDALLATDTVRRCADDAGRERLIAALEDAGFACREADGLLLLTPQDALLEAACCGDGRIDWDSPLHPVQALSARWLARERLPLTDAGRQLVFEALRLTWQPRARVLAGMQALRAQAAVMQRNGDTSGLYQAGAILDEWTHGQEEMEHED